MVKNGRRAPTLESTPPSSSSYQVGEDAKARYKHHSLMQDYDELLKETEAKKWKLQKTIQQKRKLLPEVKFLKRKYKSFMENPSQETQHRLKKQSHRIAPPPSVRISQTELPPKDSCNRAKEAPTHKKSTLLDLNQSIEEMPEFQMEWGMADKLNGCLTVDGGEAVANDLKLSICRDVGTNANRTGKRKISWQDPVSVEGLKIPLF